jgi:hypothetical protein
MIITKCSFDADGFYMTIGKLTLIGVCAAIGMYLLILYTTFFDTHKFLTIISTPANFKIDVFGAILPLCVGLTCFALYLRYGFSKMNYVICFLFSLAIAFQISHVTTGGLMSLPGIFSILISFVIVFEVTIFRKIKRKSIWDLNESYIATLLIASSCAPLSNLIADLYFVGVFQNAVIGGNGLADGVLLSTMYSPLAVTFVTALFLLSLQIYRQAKSTIE